MPQKTLFDAPEDEFATRKFLSTPLAEAYKTHVQPLKACGKATLGCDRAAINWFVRLVPEVATMPVKQIGTREVSQWRVAWAGTGLKPQTWNKHARHVRAVLRLLHDEELIPRVPKFRMLPEVDPEVRIASDDELAALLKSAALAEWPRRSPASYWQSLIVAGVTTGLRRRDLLGVRKCDVSFQFKTLTYRALKTRKLRVLPISDLCCELLTRQIAMNPPAVEHIWHSTSSPRQWYREWARIKREAGIAGRFKFHDLRSTCGSRVYQAAGLAAASEILAHSSLAVTRKHYISTQVASEALREVVDKISIRVIIPNS